jgi:lysylphosphatidylglycerol synthetase-like protein (DUF2156 family)
MLPLSDALLIYHDTLEGIRATWTLYITLASGVILLWSTSHESTRSRRNVTTVWVFLLVVTTLLLLSIMTNYDDLTLLARIAAAAPNQSDLERAYTSRLSPGGEKWIALAAHVGVVIAFYFAGRAFAGMRAPASASIGSTPGTPPAAHPTPPA